MKKLDNQFELQSNFWINGFVDFNIENFLLKEKIDNHLKDLVLNKESKNFIIKKKYNNFSQYDLRDDIKNYDIFIDFLKKNNVIKKIAQIICSDLVLVNIRVRINSYSGSSKFWGGHRDTRKVSNSQFKGHIPPEINLIYYPILFDDDKSENQIKFWSGSHKRIFSKFFDKFFNYFCKKKIIKNSNKKMILFDGSIYHAIGNSTNKRGNLRLIFTFLRQHQIQENIDGLEKIKYWKEKFDKSY